MTLASDGIAARLVLALLTTAGVLYINIGPLLVSGLLLLEEVDVAQAGYLFSVNMYGSAVGGFGLIFLVSRLKWRPSAVFLLSVVAAIDLVSMSVAEVAVLYPLRFIHGIAAGGATGLFMAVIARASKPERTLALYVVIQFSLGGAAVALLAPMLASYGIGIVWLYLAAASLVAMFLLPLLPDYPLPQSATVKAPSAQAPWLIIALSLGAIFLYQSAELGLYAYIIELGLHHDLDETFVSLTIAAALWVGVPAALVVAWWSNRSGRTLPTLFGTLSTAGVVLLLLVPHEAAYLLGSWGLAILVAMTLPYLLSIATEMDETGRTAAFAGFVNSLGLATGPVVAGMLLGDMQFQRVVIVVAALLVGSALLLVRPARWLDTTRQH